MGITRLALETTVEDFERAIRVHRDDERIMIVHMTEAKLARDAVLEKVRQGVEVVIEQGKRPVAVLKAPKPAGASSRT